MQTQKMSTTKWRVPELQQSLCGCSLQTGTKIIGWFNLVCGALTLVASIFLHIGIAVASDKVKDEENEDKQELYEMFYLGAGLIAWFVGLFGLIQIMINLLLLKGTYENKANYVWPWICAQLVFEFFNFAFELFHHQKWASQEAFVANLAVEILGILISLYLIWIVYSFYRQLKRQDDDLPPYNAHMYRV